MYHGRCANGEFQRNEGPTGCSIPFDLQFVCQNNPLLTKNSQEQRDDYESANWERLIASSLRVSKGYKMFFFQFGYMISFKFNNLF